MPRPCRKSPARIAFHDDHFLQLASSHDFFSNAWGRLEALPEEKLRDSVAEMVQCWCKHRREVEEIIQHTGWPVWFAEYGADPGRLIAECLAAPLRPWLMSVGGAS